MSTNERDSELERRAKELFDADVAGLDAHTRSRLARARNAALDAASSRRLTVWRFRPQLVPAGAVAAALLAAVLVIGRMGPAPEPVVEIAAFDDLDILLGEEELELLEELEFYAWLEDQPELDQFDDEADNTG